MGWTIYGPERNLDKAQSSLFFSLLAVGLLRDRELMTPEEPPGDFPSTSLKQTDLTEEKNTNLAHQNLDLLCFSADQPLFWKGQGIFRQPRKFAASILYFTQDLHITPQKSSKVKLGEVLK